MGTNPQQDQLFDCLSHHHRRVIIDVLRNTSSPKLTIELAQDVIEGIRETSNEEVPSFESIQNSLYHLHLPRLKDAGFVEYDEERGTVAPIEFTSQLGVLVDIAGLIAEGGGRTIVEVRDADDKPVTG